MSTLDTLQDILVRDYGLPRERLSADARLDTLGMDSLSLLELMFKIEDGFHVKIPGDPPTGSADRPRCRRVHRWSDRRSPGAGAAGRSRAERSEDVIPRRVAVTGLGVVSPLGNSIEALTRSLAEGRSGVRRLAPSLCDRLRSPIGAPADFDGAAIFDPARVRQLDRVTQLALAAAGQAVLDARLDWSTERLRTLRNFRRQRHGRRRDHRRRISNDLRRGVRPGQSLYGPCRDDDRPGVLDFHRVWPSGSRA